MENFVSNLASKSLNGYLVMGRAIRVLHLSTDIPDFGDNRCATVGSRT